jgi:hypothetical protein
MRRFLMPLLLMGKPHTNSPYSWHKIMGVPRVNFQETWCDVIHPEDHGKCSQHLEESKITSKPISFEYRVMDSSEGFYNQDECKWVKSEVLPIYNEAGEFYGFYATVTDITLLKLSEVAQKDRADEALERTRQQGQYAPLLPRAYL